MRVVLRSLPASFASMVRGPSLATSRHCVRVDRPHLPFAAQHPVTAGTARDQGVKRGSHKEPSTVAKFESSDLSRLKDDTVVPLAVTKLRGWVDESL